jgi:hypothetical protein
VAGSTDAESPSRSAGRRPRAGGTVGAGNLRPACGSEGTRSTRSPGLSCSSGRRGLLGRSGGVRPPDSTTRGRGAAARDRGSAAGDWASASRDSPGSRRRMRPAARASASGATRPPSADRVIDVGPTPVLPRSAMRATSPRCGRRASGAAVLGSVQGPTATSIRRAAGSTRTRSPAFAVPAGSSTAVGPCGWGAAGTQRSWPAHVTRGRPASARGSGEVTGATDAAEARQAPAGSSASKAIRAGPGSARAATTAPAPAMAARPRASEPPPSACPGRGAPRAVPAANARAATRSGRPGGVPRCAGSVPAGGSEGSGVREGMGVRRRCPGEEPRPNGGRFGCRLGRIHSSPR